MKEEVLPVGFNGTFYFTNFSDEEFRARWNKKEYIFPKNSTVPMIILDATPIEVQHIRRKFAKELAEREFLKTDKFAKIEAQNPNHQLSSFRVAVGYGEKDMQSLIQKCLEPLPIADAKIVSMQVEDDSKFHKEEDGSPVTKVVNQGQSLAVGTTV